MCCSHLITIFFSPHFALMPKILFTTALTDPYRLLLISAPNFQFFLPSFCSFPSTVRSPASFIFYQLLISSLCISLPHLPSNLSTLLVSLLAVLQNTVFCVVLWTVSPHLYHFKCEDRSKCHHFLIWCFAICRVDKVSLNIWHK